MQITGVNAWGLSVCIGTILIVAHQYYIDEVGDDVVRILEDAWGCWEHYDAVKSHRGGEHEYWTDAEFIIEGDIWGVLGPIHPDARSGENGGEGQ